MLAHQRAERLAPLVVFLQRKKAVDKRRFFGSEDAQRLFSRLRLVVTHMLTAVDGKKGDVSQRLGEAVSGVWIAWGEVGGSDELARPAAAVADAVDVRSRDA